MRRNQLLAGIMTALTAVMPAVSVYVDTAAASEILTSNETVQTETNIDKTTALQNSVKLIDMLSTEASGKNIMFSPTSLNFALGMIAEGAKGETKEVLSAYLGTSDFASYAKEYLDKIQAYNTEDESYGYQSKVKIADAVWMDDGLTLQEKFKNTVSNSFGAEVKAVDFSATEETCDIINSWCDKNTEGLIPKIITPDLINDNTGLCLTNSLYFESGWSGEPWNVSDTEENFGKIEKTKYMTCTGNQYYENDKSTAFGRDYANGLSFIGILPYDEGDFTLEDLDISGLLKSNPEYDAVDCKMPKLNFETSTVLNDMLSNLGLDNIFSSNADFSGIADQNVNVDTILQKTKLELDENGTKAAAVTAVTMECMSAAVEDEPIIKTVELTRPFAFLIYDRNNDEVLFIGKVMSVS
ncbi:serpin family protein [Blautia wexlerae]|uniref:serpin family protein n=1 Tax=Blautia wexlerae TaxID=418240 RepID=UPI001570457D|nr:serpin family protein [Blautia wexlerae]NSE02545.1 serpin family protein [Blautia wexlerae]NSF76214.1 serpin family protein [Blautia wexlerae]